MKNTKIIPIAIVALTFLAGLYVYPLLPEKVASHWNAAGDVDGHMERGFGAFFMPVLALFMLGLFYALPLLDPMKKNYKAFQKEYDNFVALIIGFMAYIYALTLAYNVGFQFNLTQFMAPAFAVLFYYAGAMMEKAKQNWFVGVKPPWTLSSERVWDKTHAIAGKMFKAAGIIALLGLAMPEIGLIASIAVLIAAAIFSVVYSYLEYQKEAKGKKKGKQ
ncbi:MAG: SdpI family protein [Candidatus Micrarchaeia archaeon]